MNSERDYVKKILVESFEHSLPSMVERHIALQKHSLIPNHFYSAGMTQCKASYIAGMYYGSIMLAQGVCEGLAKFIAEKNSLDSIYYSDGSDAASQLARIESLHRNGKVSEQTAVNFRKVHEARNDFHHFNRTIEVDESKLQKIALDTLWAMLEIEQDLFEYKVVDGGKLNFRNPNYWPIDPKTGDVSVVIQSNIWGI